MRLPPLSQLQSVREAAWLAITRSDQGKAFVEQTLEGWSERSQVDRNLARELASGTVRRRATLDYCVDQVAVRGMGKLRASEKALVRMLAYQLLFLERVPAYAAIDECVALAKRHGHPRFSGFLNAIGRKLAVEPPSLPQGSDPGSLAIRYSYPEWFVAQLLKEHSVETVEEVLGAMNRPPQLMARVRPSATVRPASREELAESRELYAQNVTQVELITRALSGLTPPSRILDLCAAPGGKAILVHDLFPETTLIVNDASKKRSQRLRENLERCGVEAEVHTQRGETFTLDAPVDLIILDVPCSNSGVLNKRAEARWRLTPDSLDQLCQLQPQLLEHAVQLLRPGGRICYLTCSILPTENEELVASAEERLSLSCAYSHRQLPRLDGRDGGFVALFASYGR